jgi:hypothetical protein
MNTSSQGRQFPYSQVVFLALLVGAALLVLFAFPSGTSLLRFHKPPSIAADGSRLSGIYGNLKPSAYWVAHRGEATARRNRNGGCRTQPASHGLLDRISSFLLPVVHAECDTGGARCGDHYQTFVPYECNLPGGGQCFLSQPHSSPESTYESGDQSFINPDCNCCEDFSGCLNPLP